MSSHVQYQYIKNFDDVSCNQLPVKTIIRQLYVKASEKYNSYAIFKSFVNITWIKRWSNTMNFAWKYFVWTQEHVYIKMWWKCMPGLMEIAPCDFINYININNSDLSQTADMEGFISLMWILMTNYYGYAYLFLNRKPYIIHSNLW